MLVLPSPTSLVLAWVRPRLSWRWGRSRAFGPLQGWHRGLQRWTRGPWCRDPRASGLIGESRSSPRWQSQARDGRPWTCGCFKGGQVGGEREMPAGARLRGAQQMCKENMKKKNTTFPDHFYFEWSWPNRKWLDEQLMCRNASAANEQSCNG